MIEKIQKLCDEGKNLFDKKLKFPLNIVKTHKESIEKYKEAIKLIHNNPNNIVMEIQYMTMGVITVKKLNKNEALSELCARIMYCYIDLGTDLENRDKLEYWRDKAIEYDPKNSSVYEDYILPQGLNQHQYNQGASGSPPPHQIKNKPLTPPSVIIKVE